MLAYKNFTFPLNAYAHILCKDYGDFEYLHYGLFNQDNQDIKRAQQHASDLLFAHFPPCPCRILEVGIGLGTTLSKLIGAGYNAIGISPDENQIRYAKNRHGANLPAFCAKLEEFSDPQKFNLILFQESAQYINTEALFLKASALLCDEGQIIIMDEMSLGKAPALEPCLPALDDYIALAKKHGFEVIARHDLSSQAAPTNVYIMDSVMRYREDLILDLEVSPEEIDGLIAAAQTHLAKYSNGRYGYGHLHFKKRPPEPNALVSGLAHAENEAELLELFRTAFGHEMPPDLWRWKYQGSAIIGTLVRHEGRAVAFYGGIPRAVYLFGVPATVVQIGDVMVHPRQRGILARRGPFFQAAASFLEQFVGQGKTFPLGFGFPSAKAYRLGMRLGLYDKAGEFMQVSWPALQARPSYRLRIRPLSANDSAVADRLWLEMADALPGQVIGVRDGAYLQHRYRQHPTLSYQLHLVAYRLTGIPFGIIVIRVLDDAVELLDIIAPPQRVATLVHCLRRLAKNLGKAQAYTWITAQHAQLFAGDTGGITPTGIIIPHNRWTPGIPASALLDRWWLMGGDTDFR